MAEKLVSIGEQTMILAEVLGATLEHPDCPGVLAAGIIDWFDDLRNFYGNYTDRLETARIIRLELPGYVQTMQRAEEREAQRRKTDQ